MMHPLAFRKAGISDWESIAALLQSAALPLDGAREHLDGFVLAVRGESLVGCAGLERRPRTGLLRSVAVEESERGSGLGQALVGRVLDQARGMGMRQVVLLTETARDYFPKFGFRESTRAQAPVEALESLEFKTACGESAVVMILDL